jgi:tetratricopeptide (TPR) repeat protein
MMNINTCFDMEKAVALMVQSITCKNDRRYEDALACLDEVISLNPIFFPAVFDKGVLLNTLLRHEEAAACFERVLRFTPGDANTLALLNKSLEAALQFYEHGLAAGQADAEIFYKQANILRGLQRYEEAIGRYDRALEIDPIHMDALNERGNTLIILNKYEDAIACYNRMIEASETEFSEKKVSENKVVALFNRGNALRGLNRIDEALSSYRLASSIDPDFAEAVIEQSHCNLLIGEYRQAWQQFESRWQTEQLKIYLPLSPQPLWLGKESLADKTILLLCEQGFGDTLQFLRYVYPVAKQAKQTVLRLPGPLKALVEGMATGIRIIGTEEPFPEHDFHCPLMSLPLAFGTTLETIPADIPYISAPLPQIEKWQNQLGPKTKLRVGIAWSGRQYPPANHKRDMRLETIAPLLALDIDLISLQRDVPVHDRQTIANLPGLLRMVESSVDFADSAALIANLDLVICVDTVIAHLAGAMGKPVWVMVPYIGDWRWLQNRSDSPWYPTARIFRQETHDDWTGVIRDVARQLEHALQGNSGF